MGESAEVGGGRRSHGKPSALDYRRKKPGRQRSNALTRERELELILQYQAGDRRALAELVRRMMGCVEFTVLKIGGGEKDDKMQEGLLGLLRAAEKFRPEFGVRFWTYAAWFVYERAKRCATKSAHLVSMPSTVHSRALLGRVGAVIARHAAMTGSVPDAATIADLTGETESNVNKTLLCFRSSSVPLTGSRDDWSGEGREAGAFEDEIIVEPSSDSLRMPDSLFEEKEEREESERLLDRALASLSPIEQQVLSLRYLSIGREDVRTLAEVGQLCGGLSREWVRQVEKKAKKAVAKRLAAGEAVSGQLRIVRNIGLPFGS